MSKGQRAFIRHNGKPLSERSAFERYGSRGWKTLAAMGIDAKPVGRPARYFAFRGSRQEQKLLRSAIAHLVEPFPKRVP